MKCVCLITVGMLAAGIPAAAQEAPATPAAQIAALRQELEAAKREAEALRARMQAMETQLESLELVNAKIEDHEQTKVASGSKYRMRLSGLVLVNLIGTRGSVDSLDVPLVAVAPGANDTAGTFTASVRQSNLTFEVFGADVGGARSSGALSLDFFGGFPVTAEGITEPLLRLRTARVALDWTKTLLVAGQETPLFSPLSPTSLASTAYPAMSSSGNLWVWTPQVRIERRFALSDATVFTATGGVLDPLTGEPSSEYQRTPTSGERSGLPGGAMRVGLQRTLRSRTLALGTGAYYSRQSWVRGTSLPSWAATADWDVPLSPGVAVSGEWYYGQALAGFGGGANPAVVFATPLDPTPVRSSGGWIQLKAAPLTKLELNAAYGVDAASQLTRNSSAFVNAIYQPRSNFLFSLEYRHLWTLVPGDGTFRAHHVTFSTGIGF